MIYEIVLTPLQRLPWHFLGMLRSSGDDRPQKACGNLRKCLEVLGTRGSFQVLRNHGLVCLFGGVYIYICIYIYIDYEITYTDTLYIYIYMYILRIQMYIYIYIYI